jgi:pimeloyl-ACP methyl ester carboxylesterase
MPLAADIYYHYYEGSEEGQRPPVVLIHGAGGTHLHWPSEVRRLSGYRVFALDLPGHGKSGGAGQQSIPAYAEAVLEWLAAVGLHSAVFVGHSMGGAIVLSLALDQTEHVLGLGLTGSGARLRVLPSLLEGAANPTTFHNAIEAVVAWSFAPQTSSQLVELAGQRMAEIRPSVLYGDFLACDSFDETGRIAEIKQPTLVICGMEDKMTPVRYSQYLADNIPHAILKTIPAAGHMVMLEQPRVVADALSGFLASITF